MEAYIHAFVNSDLKEMSVHLYFTYILFAEKYYNGKHNACDCVGQGHDAACSRV